MAHRIQSVLESNYFVPVEYVRRMQQCADVVCRVVNSTRILGTGFLIGRQLIITNNHILPNAESCTYVPATESTPAKGVAQFFYEDGKKTIEVPLDGKSIFLTSPSPGNKSANGNSLDFTIVALAPVPETDDLSRIYTLPLSLFKDAVTPAKDDEAVMIQHPNGDKTQVSWGSTRVITHDNINVHYNTKAAKGSSGSPVLNKARCLFALHRLGNCPEPTHPSCNQGVLIKAVVAFLDKMTSPQDPQKTWTAIIQEWIDEKDFPLEETAQRHWLKARSCLGQAKKYFEKGPKETFSRKKAHQYLSDAYVCLTEALKEYNSPKNANQKNDRQKIDQLRNVVRWQKMVVNLLLAIPNFLPHSKDQHHPMFNLLKNPEEPILTLDKWLTWQEEQVKKDPTLESNPTICFLIAFVAEEFFEYEVMANEKLLKGKLSAKWYLSLAKSYHDRGDSIFLKRACLEKSKALDPDMESDKNYIKLDISFKSREDLFKAAFTKALKELDSRPGSAKPTCFIFHDWEAKTEEWVKRDFHRHVGEVGANPLYDKRKICDDRMIRYICDGIRRSEYVLILCTPLLVEKEDQAFSFQASGTSADLPDDIQCVRFAFQMLRKFIDKGGEAGKLLRLIQDGDSQESTPLTFADAESYLLNPTFKYYENILRVLSIIKSKEGGGGEPLPPIGVQGSVDGSGSDSEGGGNLVEQLILRLNMINFGTERMEELAASGDAEANFQLAQCYAFGHRFGMARYDVDFDKALEFYKKASSLEGGDAEVRVGQILTYQKGNRREALEWFVKAEQKGNLQALVEQAKYYRKEKEINKDNLNALVKAELSLGEVERKPGYDIISKRYNVFDKATKEKLIFRHNQDLANSGDLLGMIGLVWCYENGCGVTKNLHEAAQWQRVIDRRQAEQARNQPPPVEGQGNVAPAPAENQPKPAAAAAVQQVVAQPLVAQAPKANAKNQPKPPAAAKNQLQHNFN